MKGKIQEILLRQNFKGVFRETRVESGTTSTCQVFLEGVTRKEDQSDRKDVISEVRHYP